MADDRTKRGPADAARVNITESYEVSYWSGKWKISSDQLRAAHAAAGPMAANIEAHLLKHGQLH